MKIAPLLCLVAALTLMGCAANVRKNNPDGDVVQVTPEQSKRILTRLTGSPEALASPDWERLDREWRKAMAIVGSRLGIDFAMQNATDANTQQGVLAVVTVKKFRFVAPGARLAFGVLTGNATLDTQVQFSDLQTGTPLGARSYSTASRFAQGGFSAVTDKQVEAICTEIDLAVKQ
jgi:hypothetical protein